MLGLKLDYVNKRGLKKFPVNNKWVKKQSPGDVIMRLFFVAM